MDKKKINKRLVFVIIGLFIWVSIFTSIGSAKSVEDLNQVNANLSTTQRVIMCTGFWNPTGLMLTPFSTDPELNPNGWEGENWEGSGYDIYSYFPKPGDFTGMFEVDYQDTWEDFWNITNQIHPYAIISFGAGAGPWEIEYNARNLDSWVRDEKSPYQPTPNPPDETKPVGFVRHSSLPIQQIADAVNDQTTIEAWVDLYGNPGAYLCEYIAYLGMWYQNTHNTTDDTNRCRVVGFIHVNAKVNVDEAIKATKITFRETIKYLSDINIPPEQPTITGLSSGKAGNEYEYKFLATDSEGDQIYYCINWGDNSSELTLGPYSSSYETSVTHSWNNEGTYIIKAKTRDTAGKESDWATLTVTMPYSYNIQIPHFLEVLFQRFPNAFPLLQHMMGY